jgi:hypothetical protein
MGTNHQIVNTTVSNNCAGTAGIAGKLQLAAPMTADSIRGKGGGIFAADSCVFATNSVIAYNYIQDQVNFNDIEGKCMLNYCMLLTDTLAISLGGTGNLLNTDPKFEGWPSDLRLSKFSPAINHGSPDTTGLFLPDTDIAGNPRMYGDRIDMGAYEFQGEPTEQYSVSTDMITMDSTVMGSFSVDSLTIFNYDSNPLILLGETVSPFSLSLDKTGWNTSLQEIIIPEGLPVSSLVIYVKFESLSVGDFQSFITIAAENSSLLVTVKAYCKSTEGIFEENDELNISVFPNPFRDETRISYYLKGSGDINLSVYNPSGVKVGEAKLKNQPAGINTYYWNRKSLPDGIYYLLIKTGRAVFGAKLLVVS